VTSVPPPNVARQALSAFAHRDPATQADIDRVMRALVEHAGWLVPLSYATRVWGQSRFEEYAEFPAEAPNTVLTVFTDRESAARAEGYPLGRYGGPFDGVRLLGALDSTCTALVVNPASPRDHQWYIADAGFPIANQWADGVLVERALAERGAGPLPTADLCAHRRYLLLLGRADNGLVLIEAPDAPGSLAVCFTAPDRAEEFVAALPEQLRPTAGMSVIDGPHLFRVLRELAVAGLVVNPGRPGQAVLFRADLEALTAVATPA
jgi:hypothetical protein